jgi:hypothetical protein
MKKNPGFGAFRFRYFSSSLGLLCLLLSGTELQRASADEPDRGRSGLLPFTRTVQEVTPSDGTTNSFFGESAAIYRSTAIIGAVGDNNYQGAVYVYNYVYTEANGSWIEGQKLKANDGQPGDEFAYRIALIPGTLVVGAFDTSVNGVEAAGAAYVFVQSNGLWGQTQKLVASDGSYYANLGVSVAISGQTIVLGANAAKVGNNNSQGAAYVFQKSNGVWTQVQKLTASDGAAYDNFGTSVAIYGSTIVVGAPSATVNGQLFQGAAYVFTRSNGVWTQSQKIVSENGAFGDLFGQTAALDEDNLLIDAPFAVANGHNAQGAVYAYTASGGTFSQTQEFSSTDGGSNDSFGRTISLVGNRALLGASGATVGHNNAQGKAYLFNGTGGSWRRSAIFVAQDGGLDDLFGASVALTKGTVLVATPHPTVNGHPWQGKAYFFGRTSTQSESIPPN